MILFSGPKEGPKIKGANSDPRQFEGEGFAGFAATEVQLPKWGGGGRLPPLPLFPTAMTIDLTLLTNDDCDTK